jgi:hypothetical protein
VARHKAAPEEGEAQGGNEEALGRDEVRIRLGEGETLKVKDLAVEFERRAVVEEDVGAAFLEPDHEAALERLEDCPDVVDIVGALGGGVLEEPRVMSGAIG